MRPLLEFHLCSNVVYRTSERMSCWNRGFESEWSATSIVMQMAIVSQHLSCLSALVVCKLSICYPLSPIVTHRHHRKDRLQRQGIQSKAKVSNHSLCHPSSTYYLLDCSFYFWHNHCVVRNLYWEQSLAGLGCVSFCQFMEKRENKCGQWCEL
jgi:hypothetical protein